MNLRTSLPRRVSVVVSVLLFTALVACGKKGMPPECDQYLARYECWLGKTGMDATARGNTVGTMRSTWTEASKNSTGRAAVLQACQKSQAEMESKFASTGCATAVPAGK